MTSAPVTRRLLGAVLAGGQSSRFGSDKALALLDGTSLLERAVASLAALCDSVVVVGRDQAPVPTIPDRPRPGMGPLGAVAAALHYAGQCGYEAVLTVPVDAIGMDSQALDALWPGPAFCESQPVIGVWPVSTGAIADAILGQTGRHSMRRFAQETGARAVVLANPPHNINRPEDLAALAARAQR